MEDIRTFDDSHILDAEGKIICLECGKSFEILSHHLKYAHNMRNHGYRQKHLIPNTYGLASKGYKAKRSEITLEQKESGRLKLFEKGKAPRPDSYKKDSAFFTDYRKRDMHNTLEHRKKKSRNFYIKHLRQISLQNISVRKYCMQNNIDMGSFYNYFYRKNINLKEMIRTGDYTSLWG